MPEGIIFKRCSSKHQEVYEMFWVVTEEQELPKGLSTKPPAPTLSRPALPIFIFILYYIFIFIYNYILYLYCIFYLCYIIFYSIFLHYIIFYIYNIFN